MKKFIIGIIVFVLLLVVLLLSLGYYEVALGFLIMLLPFGDMALLLGLGFLFYYVGKKIGKDRARKELRKELKNLNLENPYIYFRDIPNKYGVGVSAVLLNYELGKEDLLAAVLDLCAKGYIKLKQVDSECEIINNNKDRSILLDNEKYVLDWILNKNNLKFSYKEWIKLCKNDAILLGVANKGEEVKYKELFDFNPLFAKKLGIASIIIAFFAI